MLEIFSVLGIVGMLYLAFTFSKFIGFKKRLMAAFARRGVPYHVANDVYSKAADFINSLYGSGKTEQEVVDEVMARYPEFF